MTSASEQYLTDIDDEDEDAEGLVKPRLRGVLHEIAFFVSLVSGTPPPCRRSCSV